MRKQFSKVGLQTSRMLPGVHKVVRPLSSGGFAAYWYAWRGGPCILKVRGRSEAELARLVEERAADAVVAYRQAVRPSAPPDQLSSLIERYLKSAEYQRLAPRTQADRRRHLDLIRNEIGTMPLRALEAAGARKVLIAWRDKFKDTPKTADERLGALAIVIGWAASRGDLERHPLQKWPRLYRVDRAELIWTEADLDRLLKHAEPDFRRAVLLAAYTGLRLADLVRLTWSNVGDDAISLATGKSRGRRVVVVPITPQLRAQLDDIGRKDLGTVLTSSRGKPWTGWGLQTAMQRAKTRAGIKDLRFHDLRGTAATNFVRAGLPLSDVATIMGWSPNKVEGIARRYVTSESVAAGMLERLRKNKSGA